MLDISSQYKSQTQQRRAFSFSMVQYFPKYLGASLLLVSSAAANTVGGCKSRRLSYPETIDMDELSAANESLTLALEWAEVNPGFGDQDGYSNDIFETVCGSEPFLTRTLGGSVPGPTLTVSPGTSMKIKFQNRLSYQPKSESSRIVLHDFVEPNATVPTEGYLFTNVMDNSRLNKFNDPDVANLHFHGLHIPGTLPGDDTTLEVLPQEEYEYFVDIPVDHEPGLHWVHPHHHGSSALHLAGGAALALIVKDDKASLPLDVREATERVMIFQEWDIEEAREAAEQANDKLFLENLSEIKGGERFVTVNGQYQPITEIPVGKWERWRFLYAGWQDSPLNFGPNSEGNAADCEFHLLAKDGVYISDYPRGPMLSTTDSALPIPPGGRADFMVRCNKAGSTTRFQALGQDNILLVNSVEQQDEMQRSTGPLTTWSKTSTELPGYLQSVMSSPISEGCSCNYWFDGHDEKSRVNGKSYSPGNSFIHTSYLGAVVERSLKGTMKHSYHQHVYPFQIVSLSDEETNDPNAYFKIGDWHDTYQAKEQSAYDRNRDDRVTIRYKTTDIAGKIMVHCHNSLHSDAGMIQKEYVRNTTEDGLCKCDIFGPIAGVGIFEDFTSPKIVGAVEWYSSAGQSAAIGLVYLVPLIVAGIL